MNPRPRPLALTLGLILLAPSGCGEGSSDPGAHAPPQAGDWCGDLALSYPGQPTEGTARRALGFRVEGRSVTELELGPELPLLWDAGDERTLVSCPVELVATEVAPVTDSVFSVELDSPELEPAVLQGRFDSPTRASGTLEDLALRDDWEGCSGATRDEVTLPDVTFTATPGRCESPDASGGAGGAGPDASAGAAGAAGAETGGAAAERDCAAEVAPITVPSPLISVGLPIVASSGVTAAEGLVDGGYHNSTHPSLGVVTPEAPAWVAIDVGVGPERLLLTWTDPGWSDYRTTFGGAPGDYTIETSADSTDGEDGTWTTVATVTGNEVKARSHAFDFAGQRWVRLTVTAPGANDTDDPEVADEVEIDEIALHDLTASGSDRPQDTWLFMGDSIVDGAFDKPADATSFPALIAADHPDFTPLLINAGIGGELSGDGVDQVGLWLEWNPDVTYFAIQYGTNDSWGNHPLEATSFAENLRAIVTTVLDAGRVPVLARIPYSSDGNHETVPEFNAVVDALTVEFGLPCGPDLYGWFLAHPEELADDGVHMESRGQRSMNALWAEAMTGLYVDG